MIDDLEIHRCTHLLIRQHGERADISRDGKDRRLDGEGRSGGAAGVAPAIAGHRRVAGEGAACKGHHTLMSAV